MIQLLAMWSSIGFAQTAEDFASVIVAEFGKSRTGLVVLQSPGHRDWRTDRGYVWYDKHGPYVSVDLPTAISKARVRFHWDGTSLWRTVSGRTPELLPSSIEDRFAAVWADFNEGFPDTSVGQSVLPGKLGQTTVKIDLPGDLDSSVDTFLQFSKNGSLARVRLKDSASGESVGMANAQTSEWIGVEAFFDLPLHPDVYVKQPTARQEISPRNLPARLGSARSEPWSYAERQSVARYSLGQGGEAEASIVVQGCKEGDYFEDTAVGSWSLNPDEVNRVKDARNQCPAVTFDAVVVSSHAPADGVKTCASGQFEFVGGDGKRTPLVTIKKCEVNLRNGMRGVATPMVVALPPDVDLETHSLEFNGMVTVTCNEDSVANVSVRTGLSGWDQPKLTWLGCYPGWEF